MIVNAQLMCKPHYRETICPGCGWGQPIDIPFASSLELQSLAAFGYKDKLPLFMKSIEGQMN